ncbi:MAG: thermonuclease family protein [Gallionella sp.]
MNRPATALFCAVLLGLNGPACGDIPAPDTEQEFSARVIAVLDGDTVLILYRAGTPPASSVQGRHAGGLVKIRLAEIDAPEKAQAFGTASRNSLVEMVLHRQIWVHTVALDKYGRTVAQLKVNGLSVNEEMVRRGMAWEYSHYHSDRRYIALQTEARQAGRGLWAQHDPTPPWEWRLQHVTDKTNSHSTSRENNTRQVADYGEASRLREQPPAAASTIIEPLTGELRRRKQHATETGKSLVLAPNHYRCGSKHHCSQMRSCDEAHYYLTTCGVKALDPNGDGVPCKELCTSGR